MKSSWRLLSTCFCLGFACTFAEGSDFSRLAKLVESHYQVQREPIPIWGVIKPMFKAARPLGAKRFEIAVFEDLTPDRAGDSKELGRLTQGLLGPNWQRMVGVYSKANREQSLIYSKINGKDLRLMIVTLDSGGAVLLEVELKPAQLAKWLQDPQHIGESVKRMGEDDWQE